MKPWTFKYGQVWYDSNPLANDGRYPIWGEAAIENS